MAVASHPSRPHQQQFQTLASNIYTPSPASQNSGFFAGTDEVNGNTSHPDFTFTSAPSRPAPIASWAQNKPLAIPRSAPSFNFPSPVTTIIDDVPLPPAEEQVPDLMTDHQWQQHHQHGHSTYPHQRLGRIPAHQRNSSLSTLGSAGPSSPFTQTSSTPRIAVSDPDTDGLADFAPQETMGPIYTPKQGLHADSFHSQYPSSLSHTRLSSQAPHNQSHSSHGSKGILLPPGDFQHLVSSNPVSVASSIAGDSPATPSVEENLHPQSQLPQHRPVSKRQHQSSFNPNVPKLDRTMTDVYSDELYNPNFSITTTVSPSTPISAVSPNSDVFSQRIHAANTQHLSAAQSPATTVSRDRSPFRHGSPLAPLSQDLSASRGPVSSRPDMRYQAPQPQQQQARHFGKEGEVAAAAAMMHQRQRQQQHQHMATRMHQPHQQDSLKTISPKDALLEFSEPPEGADFPLFPQHDGNHHFLAIGDVPSAQAGHAFSSIPVTSQDGSFASYVSTGTPSQYGYMTRDNEGDINLTGNNARLQRHQEDQLPTSPQKPGSSSTGRGTFSCTYHGCPHRFETAALLQKHKREGHRQAHGLGGTRRDTVLVPGVTNTQNGPHRCTQINPSTGKPCNIEFSRPYDLTRHEDTIHNPKKKKVTCPACTDKKQFSRGDALSRHYRVCHPELTPPGKRRGGAGRG